MVYPFAIWLIAVSAPFAFQFGIKLIERRQSVSQSTDMIALNVYLSILEAADLRELNSAVRQAN